MQGKTTIISFSIGCVVFAAVLAVVLVNIGQSLPRALLAAGILLVFLFIPIAGAVRSIKTREEQKGPALQKGRMFLVRAIVLFVLSPLLVGLIVFFTYPSTFITLPLVLVVMVAASLFYFLAG